MDQLKGRLSAPRDSSGAAHKLDPAGAGTNENELVQRPSAP
jgi:hypothetical protein